MLIRHLTERKMLTETLCKLERPDVTLYYRRWGADGERDVPIFLHGWAGSLTDWAFSERHFESGLVYDAAGFGQSQIAPSREKNADYSLSRYVEDLRALLDAEGIETARLVGHSWGGVVAMEFAARYPQRVSRLVAIGSAYFDPQNWLHILFKWISYLIAWLLVLLKKPLRRSTKLRRQAARRYFYRQPDTATLDHLMSAVLASGNRALVQTLLAGYQVRFKRVCPAIKCPALYLGCDRDVVAPYRFVTPFQRLTPGSRDFMLRECGHFPMLEKPAELATLIREFWEER
jgi:pimeloyl-ACP methyl ester carboxylesterase